MYIYLFANNRYCRWNIKIFLGTSIGSLIGGLLYNKFGGIMTLRIFSTFAAFSALMYFMVHTFYLKYKSVGKEIK